MWQKVYDGQSAAMLYNGEHIFRLQQLRPPDSRQMWGIPEDDDRLADKVVEALNAWENRP
jgi:hypothetical protein